MVATGTGLVLAVNVAGGVQFAHGASISGLTYNSRDSLSSPLSKAVASLPAHSEVASNDDAKVAWNTKRVGILRVPRLRAHVTDEKGSAPFLKLIQHGNVDYLAMFTHPPEASLTARQLMDRGAHLVPVSMFSDGVLWRVEGAS